VSDGFATLSDEESHHALKVLRLKPGDALSLFDGEGTEYPAVVKGIKRGRVTCVLTETIHHLPDSPKVTLAVAVLKPAAMAWLVEKAVEIGVQAIQPMQTDRTVGRGTVDRWRRIAVAAAKQCERAFLPLIDPVRPFEAIAVPPPHAHHVTLLCLERRPCTLMACLERVRSFASELMVLVGPEGGFTPQEVALAESRGLQTVGLGPRVLRSETAALAVLSVIRYGSDLPCRG